MPAVDPERLAQDLQRLQDLLHDPQAFTRAVLGQLEQYADPARRSGLEDEIAGGERALHVRPPLLRALSREFARIAAEHPGRCLRAADHLWQAGWRESRILAIHMLQSIPRSSAATRVQGWADSTEDRRVLQELAEAGMAGQRRKSPASFLRAVRAWLRDGRERPRLLALQALRAAAEDDEFQDLPGLMRALSGVANQVRGESRRALRDLTRALARRSPAEAASFLLQEFNRDPQALAPLMQQALASFPARHQSVLAARLSTYRRAGIMPPS